MRILLTLLALVVVVLAVLMDNLWLYIGAGAFIIVAIGWWAQALWKERSRASRKSARQEDKRRNDLSALGIMEIREKKRNEPSPEPENDVEVSAADSQRAASDTNKDSSESPAVRQEESTPVKKQSEKEQEAEVSRGEEKGEVSTTQSSSATSKQRQHGAGDATVSSPEDPRVKSGDPTGDGASSSAPGAPTPVGEDEAVAAVSEEQDERRAEPSERREKEEKGPETEFDGNGASLQEILTPYLESLRAALGAQTACLLVQDEVALSYRVEGVASISSVLDVGAEFSTHEPLLTASLSRKPAALRSVDADLTQEALGYYAEERPQIAAIALAPISRPDHPSSFFLLADLSRPFDEEQAQRLIARYADLLAFLLNAHDVQEINRSLEEAASSAPQETGKLPPRRQIIAEEMERARAQDRELALAILYLNRAETIAAKGEEDVAMAERALHNWLRRAAPNSRVEPFGELTYGIFFNGSVQEAESWATSLQEKFDHAPPPLEGGASIGLAMLRPRHQSPDSFRNDATTALREAYTTGTCTILD